MVPFVVSDIDVSGGKNSIGWIIPVRKSTL